MLLLPSGDFGNIAIRPGAQRRTRAVKIAVWLLSLQQDAGLGEDNSIGDIRVDVFALVSAYLIISC